MVLIDTPPMLYLSDARVLGQAGRRRDPGGARRPDHARRGVGRQAAPGGRPHPGARHHSQRLGPQGQDPLWLLLRIRRELEGEIGRGERLRCASETCRTASPPPPGCSCSRPCCWRWPRRRCGSRTACPCCSASPGRARQPAIRAAEVPLHAQERRGRCRITAGRRPAHHARRPPAAPLQARRTAAVVERAARRYGAGGAAAGGPGLRRRRTTPCGAPCFSARPGITDLASLVYRNEEEILAAARDPEPLLPGSRAPRKLALNLRYARVHFAGQRSAAAGLDAPLQLPPVRIRPARRIERAFAPRNQVMNDRQDTFRSTGPRSGRKRSTKSWTCCAPDG